MKYALIALVVLSYLWDVVGVLLSVKRQKNPLPACVADVYDTETYTRWRAYTAERRRFGLITGGINTLLAVAILAFDLLAWGVGLFEPIDNDGLVGECLLMIAFCIVSCLLDLVPSYISTFRIEERYGFNRSTRKTFWGDFIKKTILGTAFNVGLMAAAALSMMWLGPWMAAGLFGVLMVVAIISAAFTLPFHKLFYRFDPLPEGALRSRLDELFVQNGYTVRDIYIMNASKRTPAPTPSAPASASARRSRSSITSSTTTPRTRSWRCSPTSWDTPSTAMCRFSSCSRPACTPSSPSSSAACSHGTP